MQSERSVVTVVAVVSGATPHARHEGGGGREVGGSLSEGEGGVLERERRPGGGSRPKSSCTTLSALFM